MSKKAIELRNLSVEELTGNYFDHIKELQQLKDEMKRTKKLEKPSLIRDRKRNIARLLTIIKEKQSA